MERALALDPDSTPNRWFADELGVYAGQPARGSELLREVIGTMPDPLLANQVVTSLVLAHFALQECPAAVEW